MAADEAPLRVLLTVHHHLERGAGAAGSTLALATELERRGHLVEVAGLGLLRRSLGSTADAVRFPWAVARLVRGRFERGDVDVIDASTGDLAHVAAGRIRASGTAVFTRSHGLEPLAHEARLAGARAGELALRRRYGLYHGGARLREVTASLRAADGVLVLNGDEDAYVTTTLGIAPERVWRTAPLLDPGFRAMPRTASRDVLVLGPATWRKGGDIAVRVLDTLLRTAPTATATWAGLDDPAGTMSELGDDVRDRLVVHPRFDAALEAELLASHRVLLFASRFEGSPLTLLEAMAAGIATVGSDIGGVRDALAGGAGVVVPAGHVEGFVGAVRSLLDDERAREEIGVRARAAVGILDANDVVDRLVTAYRTVLAVKRPAR